LADYKQKLKKVSENPELEAEDLLGFVLKKDRTWLITNSDEAITNQKLRTANSLINRRLKGEPLAYILGEWEFYGLPFKVNKNVLIPRPETEKLVDEIIKFFPTISSAAKTKRDSRLRGNDELVIDIGTGSGCIIISLAKNIKNKNVKFFATDISAKALAVAKKNSKLNKVEKNIAFLKGDLLRPVFTKKILNNKQTKKLIITANLPYLKPSLPGLNKEQKQALAFEPKTALFAGADGLKYYRQLAKQITQIKKTRSDLEITIYCEADPDQMTSLKKIFADAKSKIIKDFRCQDRFLMVNL
jgi:release factor glutamine methyltransferase